MKEFSRHSQSGDSGKTIEARPSFRPPQSLPFQQTTLGVEKSRLFAFSAIQICGFPPMALSTCFQKDEQFESIALEKDDFHGEWNYKIKPRKPR